MAERCATVPETPAKMPFRQSTPLSRRARQFQALSDETRLRILDLLREGERCVCELTAALDTPQPLLSFHLKTLKAAALVTDRRQGRWSYYKLNPGVLRELESYLGELPPAEAGWRAARTAL